MKIKIVKLQNVPTPVYAKDGDAGLDLCAAEEKVIEPGKRAAVATGIAMEIPQGYAGLIWDRSGLAAKQGIKTMAGVVDAGYRGEIAVVLFNTGTEEFVVKEHMRIAQMLIQKVERVEIEEVEKLSESERGDGGFGHSGAL